MKNIPVYLSTALLLAIAGISQAQVSPPGRLRAGAAKVDITPKESELAVATDTIRDHLFARAIMVDNGNTCVVLVGLDQGSTRDQITQDALPRAVAATKCPAENFIISSTHTHSSNTLGLGGAGAPTVRLTIIMDPTLRKEPGSRRTIPWQPSQQT